MRINDLGREEQICEFCSKSFLNLGRHQKFCKEKKELYSELNNKYLIERNEKIWFSGALIIGVILRGNNKSTEEYLNKLEKIKKKRVCDIENINIMKIVKQFEDNNKVILEYNEETDKIELVKEE